MMQSRADITRQMLMACLSMRDSKNDDWNLVQEFSAVPDNALVAIDTLWKSGGSDVLPFELLRFALQIKGIAVKVILHCIRCIHERWFDPRSVAGCISEIRVYMLNFMSSSFQCCTVDLTKDLVGIVDLCMVPFIETHEESGDVSAAKSCLEVVPIVLNVMAWLDKANPSTGNGHSLTSTSAVNNLLINHLLKPLWKPEAVSALCGMMCECTVHLSNVHMRLLKNNILKSAKSINGDDIGGVVRICLRLMEVSPVDAAHTWVHVLRVLYSAIPPDAHQTAETFLEQLLVDHITSRINMSGVGGDDDIAHQHVACLIMATLEHTALEQFRSIFLSTISEGRGEETTVEDVPDTDPDVVAHTTGPSNAMDGKDPSSVVKVVRPIQYKSRKILPTHIEYDNVPVLSLFDIKLLLLLQRSLLACNLTNEETFDAAAVGGQASSSCMENISMSLGTELPLPRILLEGNIMKSNTMNANDVSFSNSITDHVLYIRCSRAIWTSLLCIAHIMKYDPYSTFPVKVHESVNRQPNCTTSSSQPQSSSTEGTATSEQEYNKSVAGNILLLLRFSCLEGTFPRTEMAICEGSLSLPRTILVDVADVRRPSQGPSGYVVDQPHSQHSQYSTSSVSWLSHAGAKVMIQSCLFLIAYAHIGYDVLALLQQQISVMSTELLRAQPKIDDPLVSFLRSSEILEYSNILGDMMVTTFNEVASVRESLFALLIKGLSLCSQRLSKDLPAATIADAQTRHRTSRKNTSIVYCQLPPNAELQWQYAVLSTSDCLLKTFNKLCRTNNVDSLTQIVPTIQSYIPVLALLPISQLESTLLPIGLISIHSSVLFTTMLHTFRKCLLHKDVARQCFAIVSLVKLAANASSAVPHMGHRAGSGNDENNQAKCLQAALYAFSLPLMCRCAFYDAFEELLLTSLRSDSDNTGQFLLSDEALTLVEEKVYSTLRQKFIDLPSSTSIPQDESGYCAGGGASDVNANEVLMYSHQLCMDKFRRVNTNRFEYVVSEDMNSLLTIACAIECYRQRKFPHRMSTKPFLTCIGDLAQCLVNNYHDPSYKAPTAYEGFSEALDADFAMIQEVSPYVCFVEYIVDKVCSAGGTGGATRYLCGVIRYLVNGFGEETINSKSLLSLPAASSTSPANGNRYFMPTTTSTTSTTQELFVVDEGNAESNSSLAKVHLQCYVSITLGLLNAFKLSLAVAGASSGENVDEEKDDSGTKWIYSGVMVISAIVDLLLEVVGSTPGLDHIRDIEGLIAYNSSVCRTITNATTGAHPSTSKSQADNDVHFTLSHMKHNLSIPIAPASTLKLLDVASHHVIHYSSFLTTNKEENNFASGINARTVSTPMNEMCMIPISVSVGLIGHVCYDLRAWVSMCPDACYHTQHAHELLHLWGAIHNLYLRIATVEAEEYWCDCSMSDVEHKYAAAVDEWNKTVAKQVKSNRRSQQQSKSMYYDGLEEENDVEEMFHQRRTLFSTGSHYSTAASEDSHSPLVMDVIDRREEDVDEQQVLHGTGGMLPAFDCFFQLCVSRMPSTLKALIERCDVSDCCTSLKSFSVVPNCMGTPTATTVTRSTTTGDRRPLPSLNRLRHESTDMIRHTIFALRIEILNTLTTVGTRLHSMVLYNRGPFEEDWKAECCVRSSSWAEELLNCVRQGVTVRTFKAMLDLLEILVPEDHQSDDCFVAHPDFWNSTDSKNANGVNGSDTIVLGLQSDTNMSHFNTVIHLLEVLRLHDVPQIFLYRRLFSLIFKCCGHRKNCQLCVSLVKCLSQEKPSVNISIRHMSTSDGSSFQKENGVDSSCGDGIDKGHRDTIKCGSEQVTSGVSEDWLGDIIKECDGGDIDGDAHSVEDIHILKPKVSDGMLLLVLEHIKMLLASEPLPTSSELKGCTLVMVLNCLFSMFQGDEKLAKYGVAVENTKSSKLTSSSGKRRLRSSTSDKQPAIDSEGRQDKKPFSHIGLKCQRVIIHILLKYIKISTLECKNVIKLLNFVNSDIKPSGKPAGMMTAKAKMVPRNVRKKVHTAISSHKRGHKFMPSLDSDSSDAGSDDSRDSDYRGRSVRVRASRALPAAMMDKVRVKLPMNKSLSNESLSQLTEGGAVDAAESDKEPNTVLFTGNLVEEPRAPCNAAGSPHNTSHTPVSSGEPLHVTHPTTLLCLLTAADPIVFSDFLLSSQVDVTSYPNIPQESQSGIARRSTPVESLQRLLDSTVSQADALKEQMHLMDQLLINSKTQLTTKAANGVLSPEMISILHQLHGYTNKWVASGVFAVKSSITERSVESTSGTATRRFTGKRQRVRSRNSVIDAFLADEPRGELDSFADLEGFLV